MNIIRKQFRTNVYLATVYQLIIVLVFLQITRALFYIYNYSMFVGLSTNELFVAFAGGTRFDITAMLYLNMVFILMRILPFDFVYKMRYIKITNWIYWIFNSIGFLSNIADAPFYRFVNMRTQSIHLKEIFNDAHTVDVLLGHLRTYWYLILVFILFIGIFVWISSRVNITKPINSAFSSKKKQLIVGILIFIFSVGATIIGIRGHWHNGMPLAVSDAMLYATRNKDVNIVLNTPFSIVRTIGKDNTLDELMYFDKKECEKYINPLYSSKTGVLTKKNVVVIVIEGTGTSFIDSTNIYSKVQKASSHELTPFLNSLSKRSHSLINAYANGRRSSAGITAVLGGFPANDPFVYMLSPYVHNDVDAVASLLGKEGYSSRFLCGCNQGSYAFGAMSKAFGYQNFIDRVEYDNEYGDINYDGNWGIFDDAMGRHLIKTIDNMPQPFIASWFTLNTHGPFTIPEKYKGRYKSKDFTMNQSVEYMDDVMEEFFTSASKKSWYKNTIFIITADHGSLNEDNEFYNSPNTLYKIPLIIYAPDESIVAKTDSTVASQIDIAPTILGLLNYNKAHVSLGSDIFDKSRPHFAVNFVNGLYQIVEDRFLLQFDGKNAIALYLHDTDPTLTKDVKAKYPKDAERLTNRIKAFLQQYTHGIRENEMSIKSYK
ncbi:MAG: sulfatase-like hydrolase/transferase [Muribaculaceae bacterium]